MNGNQSAPIWGALKSLLPSCLPERCLKVILPYVWRHPEQARWQAVTNTAVSGAEHTNTVSSYPQATPVQDGRVSLFPVGCRKPGWRRQHRMCAPRLRGKMALPWGSEKPRLCPHGTHTTFAHKPLSRVSHLVTPTFRSRKSTPRIKNRNIWYTVWIMTPRWKALSSTDLHFNIFNKLIDKNCICSEFRTHRLQVSSDIVLCVFHSWL